MTLGEIVAGISVVVMVTGGITSGAFYLENRHAKQQDFRELAGWVKKESNRATIRQSKVDIRFLQNQLIMLEIQGLCKKSTYIKLCESLKRQIRRQIKR